MNILAVIPARVETKGIPNRNIRIVGRHPLIYYSISTAKKSKYITDIVVTTNESAVKIIARQMGVSIKERDENLCADDITLDDVILDAVPSNVAWDYIVTLQPTTPTLTAETLDRAIEYTVENQLDTLLSGINEPHLTWSVKGNKKVPDYEKRVNLKFLPASYRETGAFVITNACIIAEGTRIGKNVDVFEIPIEESHEIHNFEDLRSVEVALEYQSVAIYVNGNNKRGIGHIYRALELADEFYSLPDIYYDTNQTDPIVFGQTLHHLIPVNGIADLFEKCKCKNYTIFINDILTTSIDYMIGLRSVLPNAKIINFEDDGEGIFKADLVFNALYHDSELPQIYAGEKYYIANKTFMFYEPIKIKERVERVFISFGGADPQNYSDRLLKIIANDKYKDYYFVVVLGRAKYNVQELLKYNKYDNIEVLYDVSNMPELMSSCDIGITSRGRTGYELAFLGIPSIAMAQNKREEKHGFVCNENGFSYIGLNPADAIIESNLKMYLSMSRENRQHFQNMLLSHDLRGGRKRVMNLINSL